MFVYIHTYIYIYIYICVCVYIYIYISGSPDKLKIARGVHIISAVGGFLGSTRRRQKRQHLHRCHKFIHRGAHSHLFFIHRRVTAARR